MNRKTWKNLELRSFKILLTAVTMKSMKLQVQKVGLGIEGDGSESDRGIFVLWRVAG